MSAVYASILTKGQQRKTVEEKASSLSLPIVQKLDQTKSSEYVFPSILQAATCKLKL